jgi:hypothetical protein
MSAKSERRLFGLCKTGRSMEYGGGMGRSWNES